MTICIGALCENRTKGIVASDRMVTESRLSIKFEHDEKKFESLSDTCVALTAGEALSPTELFRTVKSEIEDSSKLSDIAEKVAEAFRNLKMKRVENAVLKPRGLTFNSFKKSQKTLLPEVVIRLDNTIAGAKMNLFILLVGTDVDGAHIFMVADPGQTLCFDRLGFHAIGSGLPHAVSTFITYNYTAAFSLKKAAYTVYEAKRNAEKAPGVGKALDMAVVDNNGVRYINDEEMEILDKAYKERKTLAKSESERIEKIISTLPWGGNTGS